jgi:hypothetical protein
LTGINLIFTDGLENEIIFGRKTEVDEPGIVMVSNDEGIKDISNIRFAVCELGFFPQKAYYTIKIN